MRVLIATEWGQGQHPEDCFWCQEGEFVRTPLSHKNCDCGCQRYMVGFDSRQPTTTVMVADLDISVEAYHHELTVALVESRFPPCIADEELRRLIVIAINYPAGTILSRDGRSYFLRQVIHE